MITVPNYGHLTIISIAPYLKIMDYIDQSVPSAERGDLLIFMSGIEEVRHR
jgi:hypothetical protein